MSSRAGMRGFGQQTPATPAQQDAMAPVVNQPPMGRYGRPSGPQIPGAPAAGGMNVMQLMRQIMGQRW